MFKEKLSEDLKGAMRAKDEARLRTLRSLRAALMEREIAERKGGVAELDEEQILEVLNKQAKQRRDAIEQYDMAGRDDLVAKEQEELNIIESYLPKQLSDQEIRDQLLDIINETGASSLRDMGRVMGEAMKQMRGRVDGKRVQELARGLLSDRESAG